MKKGDFELKEGPEIVTILRAEVEEIVPDADFRYSLVILKDGGKIFVCGTKQEVEENLG